MLQKGMYSAYSVYEIIFGWCRSLPSKIEFGNSVSARRLRTSLKSRLCLRN